MYPRLTGSDTLITDHDIRLFVVDRQGDVSGSAIEVVNCRKKGELHLDQPMGVNKTYPHSRRHQRPDTP